MGGPVEGSRFGSQRVLWTRRYRTTGAQHHSDCKRIYFFHFLPSVCLGTFQYHLAVFFLLSLFSYIFFIYNQQDMMNREKKDQLPAMQVGFIDSICLPVYDVSRQQSREFLLLRLNSTDSVFPSFITFFWWIPLGGSSLLSLSLLNDVFLNAMYLGLFIGERKADAPVGWGPSQSQKLAIAGWFLQSTLAGAERSDPRAKKKATRTPTTDQTQRPDKHRWGLKQQQKKIEERMLFKSANQKEETLLLPTSAFGR